MSNTIGKLIFAVMILVTFAACDSQSSNGGSSTTSPNSEAQTMALSSSEIDLVKAASGQNTESVIRTFVRLVEARAGRASAQGITVALQKELDAKFEIKCSIACEIKERENSRE